MALIPGARKLSREEAMRLALYFASQMRKRGWKTRIKQARLSASCYVTCTSIYDEIVVARVADHNRVCEDGSKTVYDQFTTRVLLSEILGDTFQLRKNESARNWKHLKAAEQRAEPK